MQQASKRPAGALATLAMATLAALGLGLGGCSATYQGERLFWKAKQLQAPIMKDPNAATPDQFARAIKGFARVHRETPGTKWAARAHLAIGSLYALQRRYAEAREAYGTVLREHYHRHDLCLTARVAIAKTYEVERQWPQAIALYREITDFHPWSRFGLEAPVYAASLHERHADPERTTEAYQAAVVTYLKLIARAPTLELGAQAKAYLALAHQKLGQWNQAVEVLEALVTEPKGVNRPLVLLTLATIYETKLAEPGKSQAIYSKLIAEFPKHAVSQHAKMRLEHLGLSLAPGPTP